MERYTKRIGWIAVLKDKKNKRKALKRLAEYEDLGIEPQQIRRMDEEYSVLAKEKAELERKLHEPGWIPVDERVPEDDRYIFLSFENNPLPDIGRYQEDEDGCAFYLGDDIVSCESYKLFVNAWMELPKRYVKKE